ncbi:MAG: hypothetical protein NC489_32425 [Ruminococcus flavefaciens]|nr:hypothetical protein [Ruminococcus flavefaciens]
MKNQKIQTVLKRLAAVTMAFAILGGSVIVPKADEIQVSEKKQEEKAVKPEPEIAEPTAAVMGTVEKVLTSKYNAGTPTTGSVAPTADVLMYGSTYCTSGGGFGYLSQWYAKMSGSMALAYTAGGCSFGADESNTNIMGKKFFVTASLKLKDYTEERGPLAHYDKTKTVLYYQ